MKNLSLADETENKKVAHREEFILLLLAYTLMEVFHQL
jgi:hypothetical protein